MKKQIKLFLLETKDFYTKEESNINYKCMELIQEKELIKEHTKLTFLNIITDSLNDYKNKISVYKDLRVKKYNEKNTLPAEGNKNTLSDEENIELKNLNKYFANIYKSINTKSMPKKFRLADEDKNRIAENEAKLKASEEYKDILQNLDIYKKVRKDISKSHKQFKVIRKDNNNNITRTLEKEKLYCIDPETKKITNNPRIKKQIALFESTLTRTLKIKPKTLTEDIIIVQTVYYDIIENLILNGFNYNDEHYCVFSSSAGQLRKKKVVFVKESAYNKYINILMCGLSKESINQHTELINGEEYKGIITNKYLSYLMLCNSSSDVWKDFDIDRAIVVNDFEAEVTDTVDYISNDFKIAKNETKSINISHSDGAGLYITDEKQDKSFQFRLPWMKGLLTPVNKETLFDYCKSIGRYSITDLDGIEHDIFDNEGNLQIQYIFSKSQFKMYKYYKDMATADLTTWEVYKKYFKELKCEASILNVEPDKFQDKEMNYQFLQSLNMDIDDIDELLQDTYDYIESAYSDIDTMLEILGATKENKRASSFQKALIEYPELLNDYHTKSKLKKAIASKKKKAKSGKFIIKGTKRMFVIPDVYAWIQFLFGQEPIGLLQKDQVSCRLYSNNIELDCLRSPSLYKEHAIKTNKVYDKNGNIKKWYISNGIYTSSQDLISKMLQFDVDGDELTIISDPKFIAIAKKSMENINPLSYELGVGKPEVIDNSNIFESMKIAWKYGEIGIYSNMLAKIWNKDNITDNDIDLAKKICFLNNCSIDAAKTKYMPTIPDDLEEQLKDIREMDLPYFFKFAKNKNKVADINGSTVNMICAKFEIIADNKFEYNFEGLDKLYIKHLMSNQNIKKSKIYEQYNEIIKNKYKEMNKSKNKEFIKVKDNYDEADSDERDTIISKSTIIYEQCKKEILSVVPDGFDIKDAVDILVDYVFRSHKERCKSLLWECFGDVILSNINKTFVCVDCGKRLKKQSPTQTRCSKCSGIRKKELDRNRKKNK
jgi:hypothetical protein